jgi:hypothetical protein
MATPELNKALAAFQASLPSIAKGETGAVKGKTKDGTPYSYTYQYADLADVSDAVMPELGKHGLAFTATPGTGDQGHLVMDYALTHESGEERAGQFPLWLLLPDRVTAQQIGGYITYARRYQRRDRCRAGGGDDDARGGDAPAPSSGGRWMNRAPAATQGPAGQAHPHATTGAEHEQLRGGTVEAAPQDRAAKRTRGQAPEGDPWLDQPPGDYPETPPEERHASIDGRQRSILMAHLGKLRREERLGKLAGLAGREVESTNDLSWVEADKAIKAIEAEQKASEQVAAAEVPTP